MEKQIIQFKLDYVLQWYNGVEINQLKNDLSELVKLRCTHINIYAEFNGYTQSVQIEPVCERMETDDEFNLRLKEKSKDAKKATTVSQNIRKTKNIYKRLKN
ncbi:MAG: hypothetical protein O9353_07870 [Bacteroidia bacterium]|nr:hypothetical protein [Bacteroidia bacterium]